jgi:uncharacterized protein with LGFP repeats
VRVARTTSLLGAALAAAVIAAVATGPAAAADEQKLTLDVLKVVDGEYVVETVVVAASTAGATERSLEAAPDVVDADVSVTYQVTGTPDPYLNPQDPGGASHVADVWSRSRGAGQVVAVLDTASTITHEDMLGAVLTGTDIVGGVEDPWHGYGSSGVIAARADNGLGGAGMAPESKILPVRVCNPAGCPSAAVARGILWAADHGADVINMSLAGAGYSDVTAAAIRYALDKNISVVASAGNEGLNGNPVEWPAANSGVIAVSATDHGGAPADWAVHGWQVDISTVGDSVLLPMPENGYGNGSGTSFSGPAVAGAVALLRASHPGIGVEQVQAALQAGADSTNWNRTYGAGRLNVPDAMAAADRAAAGVAVTGSPQAVGVTWDGNGAPGTSVRIDGSVRATSAGTSASVGALVDGTQYAADVQPDGGQRSFPVLATAGPAEPGVPTLQAASLSGSTDSASVHLTASVDGLVSPRYALIRDGVSVGVVSLTLSSTPKTISIGIGTMPTYETRWQLRAVDAYYRMSTASNALVTGSGRPPAPGAPTGLSAQRDRDRVLLNWDDLGTAYTYRVSVAGSTVAGPLTAGAVLPGPPSGVARNYDVEVVDAWGQAGPVATVQVVGAGPAAVPGAPTGLTAVAGNRQAMLTWTAAPANGSPVTGYTVTASPGGATATTTGATTVAVTGLTNGTPYTFTVRATNAIGTGPASAPSTAVTPTAPVVAPGAPGAVTAVAGNSRATVSWTPAPDNGSPVTGYTVTASPGGATATTTGATTTAVTGLTNGTGYRFTVTATNAVGTGPASAPSASVTPLLPSAIALAHEAAGGDTGPDGAPVTAEVCGLRDGGCYRGFQNGTYYSSVASGAHRISGVVAQRWAAQKWETGPLGYPTTDTVCGLAGGGCFQHFQFGSIFSSTAAGGARMVQGAIRARWAATGWDVGSLGYPMTEEICGLRDGGCYQGFQRGTVYWSVAGGAHDISGVVAQRWGTQGWETGPLGYPTTDTVCGLHGVGCFQHFQFGSIFSSAAGGARVVRGPTRDHWAATGWDFGSLGYPVTEEICGLRDGGCYQGFERGTIYRSTATGAHDISGIVAQRWAAQKWETGPLGYPTTDTVCGLHDGGCFQHFQSGSIFSSTAAGGARMVRGAIRDRWAAAGWDLGSLGYPVTEEICGLRDAGCYQGFQGGTVYWSGASGSWPVAAPVAAAWGAQGWETGRMGYPVGQATCSSGNCTQRFQGGTASWTATTPVRLSF